MNVMLEIDLYTVLFVFAGWIIGGFVSGVSGLGAMMLALPILSIVLTAHDAILTCCIVAFPCCIQLAWNYRKSVYWPDMKTLWLSCIPGCIAGTAVLKIAPVNLLQLSISLLIATFVLLECLRTKTRFCLKDSVPALALAGAASGFTGSAVSIVGVPMGIFVLLTRWDMDRARGTMSMFFLLCTLITVLTQWFSGLYSLYLIKLSLIGTLGCALGQDIGYRVGKHICQKTFVLFVLCFLTCAAIVLFSKGLFG